MAEDFLHDPYIGSEPQQQGGDRVADHVGRELDRDSGSFPI